MKIDKSSLGKKFLQFVSACGSVLECWPSEKLEFSQPFIQKGNCMDKGVNYFKRCYPELTKAHATRNSRDLNKLCEKLREDLLPYATKLVNHYGFWVVDADDFIQEALIGLTKHIYEYRYICPLCLDRYRLFEEYQDHCLKSHGCQIKPLHNIRTYLSRIMRGYMLNYKRHYLQKKRCHFVIAFGTEELEEQQHRACEDVQFLDPEIILASKRAIENVREYLGAERYRRTREFVNQILDGANLKEAYIGINEAGLSSTVKTARASIYYFRDNESDSFRQALVG